MSVLTIYVQIKIFFSRMVRSQFLYEDVILVEILIKEVFQVYFWMAKINAFTRMYTLQTVGKFVPPSAMSLNLLS